MVHPSERGVLTREGPFALACKTFLEQMMGFDKPFLIGFGFPSRKPFAVAARLGIYQEVDQITEMRWKVVRVLPDWKVRSKPVSLADEADVNVCWSEMAMAMKGSILGVRDWQYVVRRYLKHPSVAYTVLMVRARLTGRPLGVVVLRDRGQDELELIDLIGKPFNFMALVRAALRHGHLLNRSYLMAWVTSSHCDLLKVWSPVAEPLDVLIPANVWSKGPSTSDLKDQWWLMGGDTDFR
jgi:hypothetical protein